VNYKDKAIRHLAMGVWTGIICFMVFFVFLGLSMLITILILAIVILVLLIITVHELLGFVECIGEHNKQCRK